MEQVRLPKAVEACFAERALFSLICLKYALLSYEMLISGKFTVLKFIGVRACTVDESKVAWKLFSSLC